jgi:hypothetical protein
MATYDRCMSKMNADVRALVEALHAAPALATLAVTGAGSQGVAWLLGVGGASRTVLEVTMPYASASTVGYLGFEPNEFASVEVAAGLARSARHRSVELVSGLEASGAQESAAPLLGVGCTASIATDRTKRGDHRAFVGVDVGGEDVATYALNLKKGERDRVGEEELVSRLILNALAAASGVAERLELVLLPGEAEVKGSVESVELPEASELPGASG